MARSGSMVYDPQTKTWSPSGDGKGSKSSGSKGSTKKKDDSDNLTTSNSGKDSSAGKTEKQHNYIEMNTLSGTLNYIVTKQTIKIKAGDTIKIKNLGKYLSGKYYVKDVTRQIGSNGYSHSATLIKTDMGATLKPRTKSKDTKCKLKKVSSSKPRIVNSALRSSAVKNSAIRTYSVKRGDCLWNISKRYYGDGSLCTKIYDANTNQIVDPHSIYVGQVLIIS